MHESIRTSAPDCSSTAEDNACVHACARRRVWYAVQASTLQSIENDGDLIALLDGRNLAPLRLACLVVLVVERSPGLHACVIYGAFPVFCSVRKF
jgi:hypothetical protein